MATSCRSPAACSRKCLRVQNACRKCLPRDKLVNDKLAPPQVSAEHSKGRWLCCYGPFPSKGIFGTRERKNCLRRRSRVSRRMLYPCMQNLLCNIISVLSRVSFSPTNYPALGRRRCRLPGLQLDPDLLCALPCGPVEKGDSNQLG